MLDNAYEKKSKKPEAGKNPVGDAADNAGGSKPMGDPPRFVAPTHNGVDILKLLKELEDLIETTKRGPMGMMIGFNEDKFHMTVMKIRANLPEEMKRASKLATESERIVDEAHGSANRMVDEARHAALMEFERGKQESAQIKEEARKEAAREQEAARREAAQIHEECLAEANHIRMESQAEAERILTDARERSSQLVSETEVLRQAEADAAELRAAAEHDAYALRRGAEEYANDLLANIESVLSKAAGQVQRGRDMLNNGR
jgi:hypothetical protein